MPPNTPYPKYTRPMLCSDTPAAATRKPPPKQQAEVNIALRGPTRSSHLPKVAAERPRKTMAMEKIQPSVGMVQSSGRDLVIPRSFVIGMLNTLNA